MTSRLLRNFGHRPFWCTTVIRVTMENPTKLSNYGENLATEAKARYLDKLRIIGSVDPLCISTVSCESCALPPVDASDIVSYLVLQTSFVTAKQFKAHKSMEGYNQFVCGWVRDVQAYKFGEKCVVTGRVRHSQRFNDAPLKCWLICEKSGEVCCAHCTCMAGLGEACSHVAAILFYLETAARINGLSNCTQQQCQWVVPKFQKEMPYLPVKEIDFSSPKSKKRAIDNVLDNSQSPSISLSVKSKAIQPPDEKELIAFFQTLSQCGTKPAILSLVPQYASSYVPKSRQSNFPKPLQSLHDVAHQKLSLTDLQDTCDKVTLDVTEEMAVAVEEATRDQSMSRLWFTFRAGRVTASRMKQVCRTNHSKPARSLVIAICYPEAYKFKTKATQWGCEHEKLARDYYTKVTQEGHDGATVKNNGLVLNPSWPHIGASPDGIVCCKCCGKGTLEIKCPYCHRGEGIDVVASDPKSCLIKTQDGSIALDKTHTYYYQVQTQIFICNVDFCDFCVCTFPSSEIPNLHIERIFPDAELWAQCVESSTNFFKTCILPELLGKWYTRPTLPHLEEQQEQSLSQTFAYALHDHTYCKTSQ